MKKRILAALVTLALLISCFAGMGCVVGSDYSELGGETLTDLTSPQWEIIYEAEQMVPELTGRTWDKVKTLRDLYFESYFLVEYVGGGYMILDYNGQIEYSATEASPYTGLDSGLYYFGKGCYYHYADGEFRSTDSSNAFRMDEEETPSVERIKFEDVRWNDWYDECVYYCAANGILRGTSETRFSPSATLTRAMFVTALYRLAGEPEVEGEMKFLDVPEESYYYAPVLWGMQNEIVFGTGDTTFSPERPITREQMACLMVRYAELVEADFLNAEGENKLADFSAVSDYAKGSVEAIARTGLMIGDNNGMFNPRKQASRAEAAMVFMRLKQKLTPPQNATLHDCITGMQWELSEKDSQTLRVMLQKDNWSIGEPAEFLTRYYIVLDDVAYFAKSLNNETDPYVQLVVDGYYGHNPAGWMPKDREMYCDLLALLKSYIPDKADTLLYTVDTGDWAVITQEDAAALRTLLTSEKWSDKSVFPMVETAYLVLDGKYYGIEMTEIAADYPAVSIRVYEDDYTCDILGGTRAEVGEEYDAILEILSGYMK